VGDETTLIGTDRRARLVGIGLINGALLLLLLGLYFGLAQRMLPAAGVRDPVAAHGIALVCVVVLAYPLRRRLGKLVSRILRRDWQEAQDLLRDVGADLSRTIEPAGLQALLVETLPRRLRLQSATLWMLEPPDDRAFIAIGRDADEPGVTLLANGASATQVRYAPFLLHVPERRDLEWAPLLLAQGVRVALPLRVGDRLVGIYGIGGPIGQREYPPHVIDVLLMLAPAIASAVQNARAYTEIAHLNAHLRALDQLKDEFIESVGHELRTPLTSLTLAFQLLAQNPEMARDMTRVLRGSVDRLQMVVDRVLRLDRYRYEVPSRQRLLMETIELEPLLDDIVAEYRPSAQAKGLQLRVAPVTGLAAWGDGAYLRRALHEVIDNAVRYSEHGTVLLSADLRDGLVVISVADEGPGIPAEERTHLFDAFYRGRTARALAERPGVGVGLSLARRDVEVLGGQIWLQQTGKEGSVMCLSLPGVALAQNELGLAPAPQEAAKSVERAVFSRSEV
jgi:signal transduction histidine kinase